MSTFKTTDETSTPEELSLVEKSLWRTEMGVVSTSELSTVEDLANTAQTSAEAAQTSADGAQNSADTAQTAAEAAQTTANAACPDDEAVKLSGDQTITDVKTFSSFMTYGNIQDTPEGREIPGMQDVELAISQAINIPSSDIQDTDIAISGFTINSVVWNVFTINGELKFHNVNLNITNDAVVTSALITTNIPFTQTSIYSGSGTYSGTDNATPRLIIGKNAADDTLGINLTKQNGGGWDPSTWTINLTFFYPDLE